MKTILLIIIGIVVAVCFIIAIGIFISHRGIKKDNPEYIIQLIKEKMGDKSISLTIHHNDKRWIEINGNEPLPLASTMKILVAIEYAKQAADQRIDPQQVVQLSELSRFSIPKTDGGAHQAWLAELNKDREIHFVTLNEVANGMIAYSSNANTDFLMEQLGIENINRTVEDLGLLNHDPIYPLVSPLSIPLQMMDEGHLSKQKTIEVLENMSIESYRNMAIDIHNKWLVESPTEAWKKQVIKRLSMDFQKIWSDRLSHSTTADYVSIMEKLNSKTYFSTEVHKYLDPILEKLMKKPENQQWLTHAGQKGGWTAFVVTMAMYATDKDNNRTALAFFANDLTLIEQAKLSRNLNGFQRKFLRDAAFRSAIREEFINL